MTIWHPIEDAPRDGQRLLLAFPAIERQRMPGEKKQKAFRKDGKLYKGTAELVRYPARMAMGSFVNGVWYGGKTRGAYYDQPAFWMLPPDLPTELRG